MIYYFITMGLIIKVKEIIGKCPVYKVGDKIVIEDGYKINLKETSAICMHSLAAIMPYYVALNKGVNPVELGLAKEGNKAYVQCLDPCKYTGGGTVIFEIERS
ncbi:MAG: TIGR04076 family protein [Candidatus Desulfofervidus auxilii]|nr:TIGR04076 family protein [Candidatus Desulfofervidus auxilii]